MLLRFTNVLKLLALASFVLLHLNETSNAQSPIQLTDFQITKNEHLVSYFTQSNPSRELVLNASNGFFDSGSFRAYGKSPSPANEKEFIREHFTHLKPISNKKLGSARWHFWTERPGKVEIQMFIKVPKQDLDAQLHFQLDDQSTTRTLKISTEKKAQAPFTFRLKSAGKHTFTIRSIGKKPAKGIEIHQIQITGVPIQNSKLIRARWRPAAAHARFSSSTCESTQMWIFESQSDTASSSYSPMTTSFGYYGVSFNDQGQAAGGVNFSMWAASRKTKTLPPLSQLPRLLATGNPKAEFSGFGHEGSGVKIRNWEPFSHHPKSVIQALRVETKNGFDTFYGYFFNEPSNSWILYAVGKRPVKPRQKNRTRTTLTAGSFVEVPGPAASQRSGDQLRVIRRRGWFYGSDQKWHPVDKQFLGDSTKTPGNRFLGETKDGWFLTATGGIEMLRNRKKEIRLSTKPTTLPKYLKPQIAKQLFELPVEFHSSKTLRLSKNSAIIEYQISKSGTNAKGIIHFDPKDCITNVKRKIHGTEKKGLSQKMLSSDRTWEFMTEAKDIASGKNQFHLKNLNPSTRYYYRILVTNDQGKSWDFKSGQFQTPK